MGSHAKPKAKHEREPKRAWASGGSQRPWAVMRSRRRSMSEARMNRSADLENLLATREIVVTCGAGGVGKTTTAAALGTLAASRLDARVLVLTVDPARPLGNALGLQTLGKREGRGPDSPLRTPRLPGGGRPG